MSLPSFITLPYRLERAPPAFETNFIKCPESLVRFFLKEFTRRGDAVFDPFCGLGTTLFEAERLGRVPFGVEADDRRQRWVAGQLEHWPNLVHGDSFKLDRMGFPKMDFSFTSPPYMPSHHQWNPLHAGDPAHAGYPAYLKRMGGIYGRLRTIMKKKTPM